jgi:hypothetical protein
MTSVKWLIAVDMANALMGNVFVPEDIQEMLANKLIVLTQIVQITDFVSKDLVFVDKDGEVQLVQQLIMRPDNACQIAQDMETLTSKPKNVSVEVSGLEMTVPKNVVI